MKTCLIPFFLVCWLSACKKVPLQPPVTAAETKILAHKAGGSGPYHENSLEAAQYGFALLDGIETDLQLSRDGTIWLFHDEVIQTCNNEQKRIPGLTDAEIKKIAACKGLTLNTLEEVFKWHHNNGCKGFISLDVKSWLPTKYSNTHTYLLRMADAIAELAGKYATSEFLMAECENAVFLKRLKAKNHLIKTYLTTMGDFDRGLKRIVKAGFDGMSFKYEKGSVDADDIESLHQKGKRIQLWTVNNRDDIFNAAELKPDYIQTDNTTLQ